MHKKLLSVNLKCKLNLNWEFMAHHYINNLDTWKNKHSHGGGALRFYGIHVIALLAYVGYNNIIKSKLSLDLAGNPYQWSAIFSGKTFHILM